MPLSWNEIRSRAYTFVNEWDGETSEDAEAKSFYDDFFRVFGVSRRKVASFEEKIKKIDGKPGFIDLLWKGKLLIEHKSKGRDLDRAHAQARGYFHGLKDDELPRYILVSDFERFRLFDMDKNGDEIATFTLRELPEHLKLFGFIAGYEAVEVRPEDPVNIRAAEKMGKLYDRLKDAGYEGHPLQVYLVRLLFCLFAEDTGIFTDDEFSNFVRVHTGEDGSDLGPMLNQLFEVLNTPLERRYKTLPDHFGVFPYVNGKLFSEAMPTAGFDSAMREMLLEAASLKWSGISPAIFGSLFQSVMDQQERRSFGAHYTTETNILKVIKPLFLDNLYREFEQAKAIKTASQQKNAFQQFSKKLSTLTFLDPACGCGNFLVIAYRELRLLELEALKALYLDQGVLFDVSDIIQVNVDQFYGIEIEEFPAQIAQVAMWLVDHQMNLLVSSTFGQYFARLPLRKSATVVNGNALELDWQEVVPKDKLNYILGNPPFIGSKYQSEEQRQDLGRVIGSVKGAGVLDFVCGWYVLAARYIQGTTIEVALVSTNSITQGEQVGILWPYLLETYGVKINFGHRTFQWQSEARGKAAVHCVIIGFATFDRRDKRIFEYETVKADPHEVRAQNVNPYLVDGPSVALPNRRQPLCDVPQFGIGNKPIDGGNYLFTPGEKAEFLAKEPGAEPYFRRWIGSEEYLNNIERWCLWLGDAPPSELRKLPESLRRIEAVRQLRLKSKSAPTRKIADTPTRFHVENMPSSTYLVIPKVSSERRKFIPIGFMNPEVMASDLVFVSKVASPYHLGVISSTMHMTWVRYVGGRLKSDYRYSTGIVYNNFPWPMDVKPAQRKAVENAAQGVLEARAMYPDSSLADLYDPLTTPPELTRAHQKLDRAVDLCYRPQTFTTELNRMEFLFNLYTELSAPLLGRPEKKRGARAKLKTLS